MLATPVIAPSTGAVNKAPIGGTESDKILILTSGAGLATTETVLVWVANTSNGFVPVYTPAGTQVTLGATLQSYLLEGGITYYVDKSATAGPCGVDVIFKPRQGS